MSDVQTLKSYLVGLGFDVNAQQYRKFESTLADAAKSVHRETASIGVSLLKWQAGIIGMFTTVSTAILGTMDKVAKADQEYRLFGERMFMDTQHARSFKIALDALGQPMEAIAFDPELHERFVQLQKDQLAMTQGIGGDFSANMRGIRDFTFELTRLKVELQYLAMGTVNEIFKSLGMGAGGFLQNLRHINDWIIHNIPYLSQMFAKYLVPILKDTWRIGKDVLEILGAFAIEFTNIIGALTGDSSIQGVTFSFEKFASAVEKVVSGLAWVLEHLLAIEKHLGGGFGVLAGAGIGAGIGSIIPGIGTGAGALIGGGLGLGADVLAHIGASRASGVGSGSGIDMQRLVRSVMGAESGGNPNAVSGAGAMGLMQLMPKTAAGLGVDINNPADNLRGGQIYLQQMLKHYKGNLTQALQAYNWGPGNMDAYLRTGKGLRGQAMPMETQQYADRVMSRYNRSGMEAGVGGKSSAAGGPVTIGEINIMQPNASADEIAQNVVSKIQSQQNKQTQRNLTELATVIQ